MSRVTTIPHLSPLVFSTTGPLVFHWKGSQYTCAHWVECLNDMGIRISMDGKGRATDNAIIERWFRTLKQKYIYLNPAQTGLSLFYGVRKFVDKYNHRRHQGIDRKKPVNMYHRAT